MGYKSHRIHQITEGEKVKAGSFTVLPFASKHDACQPLGFVINHPEMGNTLFLTDSYYAGYKFKNLHHLLIEANYSEDILEANMFSGKINPFVAERIRSSHMSDTTLKELLLANDLRQVQNIVLIHLSDSNSHALRFANEIHELTGKSVMIADTNTVIELNKTPF